MRLFDFSLRFNGYQIDKARQALSQIQLRLSKDPEHYIEEKKREVYLYHLMHNAFYKSLVNTDEYTNWAAVPVMTKRDLQQALDDRLSDEYKKHSVYVNKTSGSSGDPFIFAKDKWSHALTWAVIMDRFAWYDLDFNRSLQARFYGIPLDKKGYYKERLKDYFSNRFRFSVFDLSDAAFEKCLRKFSHTPFDYINGYTSPIVQFAKFLKRKNVVLTTVCPNLKACMVTSEMLFDDDKALMETQFGVPVVNEYGASELDLIAFQNKEDNFQLNSETLYVEILDEHDNILPPGEEGRIVITSLYNKAHPFIRYDIGDIGIISAKGSSAKPILEKLIGRTNDIAELPSGKKAAGLTFYYITKSIIEDDGNVKEFIIEQFTLKNFKVSYVSQESLSQERIKFIKKEMENYLETGIDITFERTDKLERSKSGKLKQFTSYLKP
ncbi:MAG: phenylacetate--CoA ligase family protein [Bacteroidia bacterium]|nr:phenylacetate--CoA ligase family protein [Bacteroidia bacterium]MBT8279233.1 phenylacetate--CoA ligase family protein [Bacteroidia bacterium]NNK59769.1 phenylacetate--CoA ligase family protein [Flavobacteriaceae bacterium]RZW56035.1 MAG: phenylacetate--CoA ligase family protein [Flavobacteriaceae bacterium]